VQPLREGLVCEYVSVSFFVIINEERVSFGIVFLECPSGHWGIGVVIASARLRGAGGLISAR